MMHWTVWTLIASLTTGLGICLVLLWRHRQESMCLSDEISQFLNGEIDIPVFSVRDNSFAQFENAVVELETRLRQSQENERSEGQRTAELVADVSHQLKTPLAGLKLYCEMDDSPHQAQSLQMIEHMERLVHSLLRLEKLRSDAYEFHFARHELANIARDAVQEVHPLFPGRAIEIVGQATLRCDAYWMGEALMNLAKNACEYTPMGSGIRIELSQTDGLAVCKVSDSGGGVPTAEMPQLFRRFSRGNASGGVGLGLSIVRAVTEKHHGIVQAQNIDGGLSITLSFPQLHHLLKET